MKQYAIGVDVGGTNIKLGLVNRAGTIAARSFLDTKSFCKNKKKLTDALIDAIRDLMKQKGLGSRDITGIGMGLPGLIDSKQGVVNFLPNIPGWKNVPLKKIVQQSLRIPTFVENDVNLIALGEWKFGAGKGYDNLLCMTLGTGVGGGLILDGNIYRGEGFVAGELGHMPLNEEGLRCNCGGWGCFERYVGNGYLKKKAEKIFKNKKISLPDIYHLAQQGDRRAILFWEETGRHIGNGLVGVVNLLNLRLIVIGGGVANSFRFMKRAINDVIKRRAMSVQSKMVKVVHAKLGNDAGIKGAQVLVKDTKRERYKA